MDKIYEVVYLEPYLVQVRGVHGTRITKEPAVSKRGKGFPNVDIFVISEVFQN